MRPATGIPESDCKGIAFRSYGKAFLEKNFSGLNIELRRRLFNSRRLSSMVRYSGIYLPKYLL